MNCDQLLSAISLKINFLEYGCDPLPFAAQLASTFLTSKGKQIIKYEFSSIILGCQVIKLYDDWLKYVVILPNGSYDGQSEDQFIWFTDHELADENAVMPLDVSMYLIAKEFPSIFRSTND